MGALEDLLTKLGTLSDKDRAQVEREALEATQHMKWVPNPGPQTDAYLSEADILLYGGQAGGGKTHLELGIGINDATSGIIFRRELTQTDGLEKEGKAIVGLDAGFNGVDHEWTWQGVDKTLKLGGMRGPDDWQPHAGRERDYIGFDEGGEFLEVQVASIMAWMRAAPGKRCRMVIGSNPPRTAEGLWLLDWFAPWLDERHPLYPTAPGKLLWAVYIATPDGGHTEWVEGPGAYTINGEEYIAKSRTFIPASLDDNPYRNTPEYRATLQSLPEPLRSQLLYGNWKAGLKDAANQCIPTDWVRAAQERWKPTPPIAIPMCAIGVDCSGGGDDQMVQAPRYDAWFAPLIKTKGSEIPKNNMGPYTAGLVIATRRDGAIPIIDMGGGYGGSIYDHLKENDVECYAYKGAEATTRRSRDKKLGFTNVRSAAYWGFREALDPSQPGGSPIALPPDPRLLAGLCAPTFEVTARGIKVEPKSKSDGGTKGVLERLGFSPDEADAVVMSWWQGPKEITDALAWADARVEMQTQLKRRLGGARPKAVVGREHSKVGKPGRG